MMRITIFLFIAVLLLPIYAAAGFKIKQPIPTSCSNQAVHTVAEAEHSAFYCYSKQAGLDDGKSNIGASDKQLGTWSLLLAMGGLVSLGIMIAFLPTSMLGVCIAGGMMLILGLGALGTGYMSAGGPHHTHHSDIRATHTHKKEGTLAGIGFTLGMIESLPILLVGGLFVGIFEIGRFVFRKRHKKTN